MDLEKIIDNSFLKRGLRIGKRLFFTSLLGAALLVNSCSKKGDEAPTGPSGNQPPTVEIISGPSNGSTIYENEASFTWQGHDEDGDIVGYEYKLPPKINDYDYTIFSSLTFIFLEDGENYTLYVKAKDNDGDYSSPDMRSFNVDLQPTGNSGMTDVNGYVNLGVNINIFTVHVTNLSGNNLSNVLVTGDYYGGNIYEFLAEKAGYYSNVYYLGDYINSSSGIRSLDDLNISMRNKTSSAYYAEERDVPYMANNPNLNFVGTATLGDLATFYQQHDVLFQDVSFLEFLTNESVGIDELTVALEMNKFRTEFINNISNVNAVMNEIASLFGQGFDEDALYYDFYLHDSLHVLTHTQNTNNLCTVKGIVYYNNIPANNAYVSVISGIPPASDYTNSSGEYILKFLNDDNYYTFEATYNNYEDLESRVVNYPNPPFYTSTIVNFYISPQENTITIQPNPSDGKDAYIASAYSYGSFLYENENYGNTQDFSVTYYSTGPQYWIKNRFLIKFDIPSTIDNVIDAQLGLYGFNTFEGDYNSYRVKRVTQSWNESNVTWNNQPSYSSDIYDTKSPSTNWGWTYFDMTELVQKWVQGIYSNYGFIITTDFDMGNHTYSGWTSDYFDSSKRPKLEITYE